MANMSRAVNGRHAVASGRMVLGSLSSTHIFHALKHVNLTRRHPPPSVALKSMGRDTLTDLFANKAADTLTRESRRKAR